MCSDTQAQEMIELLQRIAAQVERTAIAMEQMSAGAAPEPNLKRPIGAFPGFDWSSIGATVLDTDEGGVSTVEHRGLVYTRRSGTGRYGDAVWFSRSLGRGSSRDSAGGDDGPVAYAKLIVFKDYTPAEPIARATREAVAESKNGQAARYQRAPAAAQPSAPKPPPRYEARMVDEMPPSAFAGIPDRQSRGDRPPSAPAPMPPELVAEMSGQASMAPRWKAPDAPADPEPLSAGAMGVAAADLASEPAPEASGSEWGALIEAAEQSGTMAGFIGAGGVRVELARAADVTEAEREDWLALADSAMCRVVAKVAGAGALSEPARAAAIKRIEQVPEGTPGREGALSALAGAEDGR